MEATINKLREQQDKLKLEQHRFHFDKFLRTLTVILQPHQKEWKKTAFEAIKSQRERVDRLSTQVAAFRRFQLLYLVFHNFKELLKLKKKKVLEAAQEMNYLEERFSLAIEMHSFNLKTKALTSFIKFVEQSRELKAKVEVVGKVALKVNNFKEKLREEKEKAEKEKDEVERQAYRELVKKKDREELDNIRNLRTEEAKRLLVGFETKDNFDKINQEISNEEDVINETPKRDDSMSANFMKESGLSDFIHNERIVYQDSKSADPFTDGIEAPIDGEMIQSNEDVRQTLTLRTLLLLS